VNTGPVVVTSDGEPIVVTERLAWWVDGWPTSIMEMMGLPANQVTTSYVFSWYNNATMDTQLRIGVP
jgi:hypothetical protein